MKNKKLISKLGYSDGSPFKDEPYLDIHTSNGKIDMSNTGIPLWANGRILPPYSGIHHFDTDIVREIPLPKAQSLGEIKDRLSNYLSGNEGLLPGNQTSIKQSVKDRLYNSVTPIAYDPKHAMKEFVAGKQLPFMWDGKETSFDEFQNQPMFRGDTEYGEYSKNASMDAWGNYLGQPQKHDTFKQSSYQPGSFSFNNDDDIWDDVLHLDIINKLKAGQDEQVYDSAAGGFSLNNYILKKELDKDIDMPYVSYRDKNDYNVKLGPFNIEGESIVGNPFNVYGRMYYDPETNERLSEEDIYKLKLDKSRNRNLQKQEGGEYEELELTDEEIEEYKKGGYVVEELPKAQNGLIVHDQNDPRLVAYKDSLWLHENNLDPYYNWDGVWKTDSGENMLSYFTGIGAHSSKPTVTSNSSIIPELSIKNRKSNIPLYTKGIKNANSNNSTKNYYPLPNFYYDESETKNLWGYSDELIKDMNYIAKQQAIKKNQIKYLEKNPEESYGKGWGELSEIGGIKVEGKSQDESPYFKHFDNIPANKPEIYYIKDFYDRWHNNLLDTYFTLPLEDYKENITHYARYAKPKQKVTYVPENNVGDNSNWPTSNSYKSSYGIIKKPSYADAYKNVDKDKYPTLESFIEAAENYKKYGSNTKPESKPEETKVLKSETKEKKLKKPTTKKEVIKKPEIPEGYALSKGYQRDGVSYGDMWHDIESTRPSIPAGPTMKDYYAKYPKSSDIAIDDDFQSGGTVSQLWKQATGTPWSEAKKQGLTDGSYANNIALRKRIISGEFNSVPSQTSSRYIKEDFDYEKYGENIKRLLEEGNTLDDLVRKRIGTRAGLTNMFPELFDMPQMPEIPEQTFEPLTQNLPKQVVEEEDVEVSNNPTVNVPDWISNSAYTPPLTSNTQVEETQEEPAEIPSWINQSPFQIDPNYVLPESKSVEEEPAEIPSWISQSPVQIDPDYAFPDKNKKQDGLKSFLSQFENDEEVLDNEQRQSINLSIDQEKDKQKKAELIQQKEKEYLEQLKIEEQQRIDDYKNEILIQYGKDKISDLKQVGKNVYEEAVSNINEIKNEFNFLKNNIYDNINRGAVKYLNKDVYNTEKVDVKIDLSETEPNETYNDFTNPYTKKTFNLNRAPYKDLYAKEELKQVKTIREVADETARKDLKEGSKFKKLGSVKDYTGNIMMYQNEFDAKDGFNYVPIKNYSKSDKNTSYNNVEGIAHFLLDSDATDGYKHEYAKKMINQQLSGEPIISASSVKDFYFPVYETLDNGQVNVKYLKKNEIQDLDSIMSPLRQFKWSDLDWEGKTNSAGFQNTVSSIPTKNQYTITNKNGKKVKTNKTHLIFPTSDSRGGKGAYGRFGGTGVVFFIELPNDERKIIEVAGSINMIKDTAKSIMKKYNLKPNELTFGYHDVGSFSARPESNKSKTLKFNQWSGYNKANNSWVGGALAFPSKNKKLGGEINQFELGGQYMDLDLTEEEIKEYKKGGFVIKDLPKAQNLGQVPELAPSYEFPYEYLEENTGDPEERLQFYGVNDPAKGAYPGAFDFRKDLIKYSDFTRPIGTSNAEGFEESDFRNKRHRGRKRRRNLLKGFRKDYVDDFKSKSQEWNDAKTLFGQEPFGNYLDLLPLNYGGELPAHQAPPGQVISSTYSEYPFQIPEIVDTNLNDTITPFSNKKRFNSYTITGDPNKPHRRSASNIIYDMFHKPGSSEIKHDFNFKDGGENKYQKPPGQVTIGDKVYDTTSNEYRKLIESGKVKPYTTDTESGVGAFDYGNLPDFEVTAPTQEAVDMAKSAFNRSKQGQAKQQGIQDFQNNDIKRYRYPESGATKGILESLVEGVIDDPNNLSYYPGVGELYDAGHLGHSLRQGNYEDAAYDAAAFGIPFVGGKLIKNLVKKIATGNSIIPYAWKTGLEGTENFKAFDEIVGANLSAKDSKVIAEYMRQPRVFNAGTENRKLLDKIIENNPSINSKINSPLTRIEGYYATSVSDASKLPTAYGSKIPQDYNRSFSVGKLPGGGYKGAQRIVIPEKYAKTMGDKFFKIPYKESNLEKYINKNQSIESLMNEKELIGNPNLKVIGRTISDGYENIIVKPSKFNGGEIEYLDLDLTEDQIKNYQKGGFVVENLPTHQTPPGEVKEFLNSVSNSYPEKGNPAIDMLDLDVFGTLNEFFVEPAKRVIQDPIGTVKSIGNTAADVASFFNPFSIGSAEPLIESMVNKDINFGGDGNNAFGTPYWTDNALALDAAVIAPALRVIGKGASSTFKALTKMPNKSVPLNKVIHPIDYNPVTGNPNAYPEPYLMSRQKPFSKEDDIINSFYSPEKRSELYKQNTIKYDPQGNIIPNKSVKINNENFYRSIDLDDAISSGVIRSKQSGEYAKSNPYFVEGKDFDKLSSTGSGASGGKPEYIFEIPMVDETGTSLRAWPTNATAEYSPYIANKSSIPISEGKIYKLNNKGEYELFNPKKLPGSPNTNLKGENKISKSLKASTKRTTLDPMVQDPMVQKEIPSKSVFRGNNEYNEGVVIDNKELAELRQDSNPIIARKFQEQSDNLPLPNVDEYVLPLIENFNNPAARKKLIKMGIKDPDDFVSYLYNEVQWTDVPGETGKVGDAFGGVPNVNDYVNMSVATPDPTNSFGYVPNIISHTGDHEIGHLMQRYMKKRGLTSNVTTELDKEAAKFFRENKNKDFEKWKNLYDIDEYYENIIDNYDYTQKDYVSSGYHINKEGFEENLMEAKKALVETPYNKYGNGKKIKEINQNQYRLAEMRLDKFNKMYPNLETFMNSDKRQILEPLAHLRELRNELHQSGIIKNFQDPIDEGMLMKFWKSDNGKQNRILSFLQPSKKAKSGIVKLINKTPIVAGAIGTGAVLSQEEDGGEIGYKSKKEIEDLINQGYGIEYLD